MFDLPFIFAGIIAFSVLVYVILDGFDLGVGILYPLARDESERDVMMNTIAPIWDGNETWLVLGGGGLLAVFPLAYAVVMPALYMPITIMLLALVFRGVAFEFRWKTERWKRLWDHAFFGGSLIAALAQGIALGALVQGIKLENRAYAGGWWDWLTPFSILTGLAVAIGFALLGALWLNLKTEGVLQTRMRGLARGLAGATVAAIGIVSLWTPFQDPVYFERWFTMPAALYAAYVPVLLAAAIFWLFRGLARGAELGPFLAGLSLFVISFIGIGISFYPMMVPPGLTIDAAAAPEASLAFTLVGVVILIPIILAYTAFSYWVFRGKVRPGDGYH